MHTLRSNLSVHLFIVLALLTSLLGSTIGITPAYATTLIVTTTADSGAGSLRNTIASAGVSDTITFDAALSGQTIFLASTLTLAQDVTIDGSALASPITISGDTDNDTTGDVRVLYLNSGVTATLDSLIITKGAAGGGDGGGIFNNGATLTINNSTLSGNSAGSYGGGISNTGTLTINNSTLSGNSGGYGGGIHNALTGTLTITNNSALTGNSATSAGGGIHSGGGVTITGSILSGNSSSSTGGGIYTDGTLTITNSTLSSNPASSSGGGIYSNTGTVTVTDSTLSGNTAALGSGAGIYNFGSTLNVTNSTFSGNGASGSGGGIYNYPGNTLNITNSTFSGNGALYGGGIINYGALIITNSTLSGNTATNNGGGIYNDTSPLNYANTIIANSVSGGDCYNLNSIGTNINNLVEDNTCSPSLSGDPNLGALANNGGSTQTLVLLTGSSAIDAGDDTICTNAPVGNLDQRGVTRPVGAHCDIGAVEYVDTSAPTVTSFTVTLASASLSISITAFTASDDVGVTGYLITESATPPSAGAAGWTGSAPTMYTVGSDGSYSLYPWAKDAAGNVSLAGAAAIVSVDTTAPTVSSFTATTPSASRNISITAFTATDAVGVAGYKITETSTPPSAGATGWTSSAPTTYTVGSDGSYSLYPWAKDASGKVSPVVGSPASVSVDTSVLTVLSSVRVNLNPTSAASVDFAVTFSESVTGVDAADFSLTTTGTISGAVVSGVSGSGATYTVTVNTGSGSGTIRLDVADNDSIVDATANPLGGSGAGNGAFTSGETYTKHVNRIYLSVVLRG